MIAAGGTVSKAKKEALRKKQIKQIRRKYGIGTGAIRTEKASTSTVSYKDRAKERRVTLGSDNPYEKTAVASLDE